MRVVVRNLLGISVLALGDDALVAAAHLQVDAAVMPGSRAGRADMLHVIALLAVVRG